MRLDTRGCASKTDGAPWLQWSVSSEREARCPAELLQIRQNSLLATLAGQCELCRRMESMGFVSIGRDRAMREGEDVTSGMGGTQAVG